MCVKGSLVLVLVLDWTQCLPQGVGAPPAMLRGCTPGFPKKMGSRASGEAEKVDTTSRLYPFGATPPCLVSHHHRCVIKPSFSLVPRIVFLSSAHCFPTSVNIIRASKDQGCASWEHCNMCAVVSFLLFYKNMWYFLCRTSSFPLCFAASIPCTQTVEAPPCGPWTVITFFPSLREG